MTAPMTALLAKTFSIESTELWFQLRQVYMHEELLRPVFVWGVGLGTLLLLIALVLKDERLKRTALVVAGAAGLAVIPYLQMRAESSQKPHPGAEYSAKVTRLRQESRWVFLGLGAGTSAKSSLASGLPRVVISVVGKGSSAHAKVVADKRRCKRKTRSMIRGDYGLECFVTPLIG